VYDLTKRFGRVGIGGGANDGINSSVFGFVLFLLVALVSSGIVNMCIRDCTKLFELWSFLSGEVTIGLGLSYAGGLNGLVGLL
jgi:hypothetical protein